MTPQQTIESESTSSDGPQTFADWFQFSTRYVWIGAIVLLIGAVGYWYYLRSGDLKRMNAERQLTQAKQALAAGNAALAVSDLQKTVERYQGTPAGSEAAMLLAQMQFDQARYADGLKVLQPYATRSASGANLAPVLSLIGDGQIMSGKVDEAASAYKDAAEATSFPGEKALYRAKQARALMAGGKTADARTLWQELLDDPGASAVRSEATVRLGELEAKPATGG